jgi:hypothetical protein
LDSGDQCYYCLNIGVSPRVVLLDRFSIGTPNP